MTLPTYPRLIRMVFRVPTTVLALALAVATLQPAAAQRVVPPNAEPGPFKDTGPLKLHTGDRVAIMEFEDLECPACAHASPIVHTALDHYKIPYYRYDFPLQMHIWSRDAAITARYLQDKVSPAAGDAFRKDVFANQLSIASKDDLNNFTRRWFDSKKLQVPFVMDPAGLFAAEVQSDERLGERIGLRETPSIFVLDSKGWTQIKDVTQLYSAIDNAEAESKAPVSPARTNLRRPKTTQN